MSFLRKRRGSHCSFTNGEDEITVRKVEHVDVGRKSRSDTIQSARSSSSIVEASDFVINDSCVLQNFPKYKSSHLRFLAWVAYTRKYTDEFITEDERRTCPLLWCRDVFENQEAMLRHVCNCSYLEKGLYWCFHCQKPERVGKFNCKRCQGAPSRTDRMTLVAKKIFSKLGAKHVKQHLSEHNTSSSSPERSKGHSKGFGESDSSAPPYFQEPIQHDHSMNWGHPDAQELPNSAVVLEMTGDWTSASYELPNTYISEMGDGSIIEAWEDNFYAENLEEWDIPSLPYPKLPKGRGSSPKLEIDTSVSHTSQPTKWLDTPLSATIISPMSAFGGKFEFSTSSSSSPVEISPTDSDASGKSFFTDSGYSTATTPLSATYSSKIFDRYPRIGEKGKREFGNVSEAWIEDSALATPQSITSVNTMPIITPTIKTQKIAHSAHRCTGPFGPTLTSPHSHWHNAPRLVLSFSESLNAHIQHTRSALQTLSQTTTTRELMSMSRTSIVSIGFEVLTGILEGRTPTAIDQIFAFTHIACALAIASENGEAKIHTQKWFEDSLQWSAGLREERQQEVYEKVARAVWQPPEILAVHEPSRLLQDQDSKEWNSLLATCKHFLDIFEILDSPKTAGSTAHAQFNFAQASFESKAKTRIIDELIKKPQIEAFIEDVVNVERRLLQGRIVSIRDFELELIGAGKLASQSDIAYNRFLQHVAMLCDTMYAEEPSKMSRTRCHVRSISRIKKLMPDEKSLLLDMNFESAHGEAAAVDKHHDAMLRFKHGGQTSFHVGSQQTYTHDSPTSNQSQHQNISHLPTITLRPPTPTQTPITTSPAALVSPSPATTIPTTPMPSTTPPSSQSSHRCHCGYRPKGEERWKASNLQRHKRIQHSDQTRVYSCPWKGCKSSFTRSDNLRCHIREKGHREDAEKSGGGDMGRRGRRGKELGI